MKKVPLSLTYLALTLITGVLTYYSFHAGETHPSTVLAPVTSSENLLYSTLEKRKTDPLDSQTGEKNTPPKVRKNRLQKDQRAVTQDEALVLPKRTDRRRSVTPPLKSKQIPFLSFKVNPAQGTEWIHPVTGTRISFSPMAFVNANGEPVTDEVTILYREFDKPSEIFLSGIPMNWKKESYLESAGMLEIRGYAGDQQVFLDKNKPVTITMDSPFTDKNYNLYSFNEQNGEWVQENQRFSYASLNSDTDIGPNDKGEKIPGFIIVIDSTRLKNIAGFSIEQKDQLMKTETTIVRHTQIQLNYISQYFPELNKLGMYTYKSVSYTYSELEEILNNMLRRNHTDNGGQQTLSYDNLRVLYPGSRGPVDIAFYEGQNQFIIGVEPVLKSGKEQRKFIAEYNQYAARYDSAYTRRQYTYMRRKVMVDDINSIQDEKLKQQAFLYRNRETVTRTFLANKFGIWNCDRPVNPNGEIIVNARFFYKGSANGIELVYTADFSRNGIMEALPNHFKDFRYSVMSDNMIWTVLPGDKIGYLLPDDLKAVEVNNGNADFHFKESSLDEFLSVMDERFDFTLPDKNTTALK